MNFVIEPCIGLAFLIRVCTALKPLVDLCIRRRPGSQVFAGIGRSSNNTPSVPLAANDLVEAAWCNCPGGSGDVLPYLGTAGTRTVVKQEGIATGLTSGLPVCALMLCTVVYLTTPNLFHRLVDVGIHPAKEKFSTSVAIASFRTLLLLFLPGCVAFDLDDRLVKEVFGQLFFPGHVLLDLVAYQRREVFLPLRSSRGTGRYVALLRLD